MVLLLVGGGSGASDEADAEAEENFEPLGVQDPNPTTSAHPNPNPTTQVIAAACLKPRRGLLFTDDGIEYEPPPERAICSKRVFPPATGGVPTSLIEQAPSWLWYACCGPGSSVIEGAQTNTGPASLVVASAVCEADRVS